MKRTMGNPRVVFATVEAVGGVRSGGDDGVHCGGEPTVDRPKYLRGIMEEVVGSVQVECFAAKLIE